MTLYQIISTLKGMKGTKEKAAFLLEHRDNELLKAFCKAALDPKIKYYMSKLPKVAPGNLATVDQEFLEWLQENICNRAYTGSAAKVIMQQMMASMDEEGQELTAMLFDHKIPGGVGDSLVLGTWPGLYYVPPYQRCNLLKAVLKKFAAAEWFYVQKKMDGAFAYAVSDSDAEIPYRLITRQGHDYPEWFAKRVCKWNENESVLVGELVVIKDGKVLDRKTGNGILNSIASSEESCMEFDQYAYDHVTWDELTLAEFTCGASFRTYEERFESMEKHNSCTLVETYKVRSLADAYAINTRMTQEGEEGTCWKLPSSLWKDGTATDIAKAKIKFEAEFRITGMYEGEGEMVGMMGGVHYESLDGGIKGKCGTGFSKQQRIAFWLTPHLIVDTISTLSANDITHSRDELKAFALSHCAFEEVRADKQNSSADTTEHVFAQLENARQGK